MFSHRPLPALILLMFAASPLGCDASREATTPTPIAQAPTGPLRATPPAPAPEEDEDAPAPTPVVEEPEDEAAGEKEAPGELAITRFHGVKHLPREHPCHDATRVVVEANYRDPATGQLVPKLSVHTLGALRQHPDEGWAHFGPRLVRGARWSTAAGDFLVATCQMPGGGFNTDVGWQQDKLGASAADAVFSLDAMSEVNSVAYASILWMERRPGQSTWRTIDQEQVWSNDDEGNDPQYLAQAQLLSVQDADGDGTVEVSAFTLEDCRTFNAERCPGGSYDHQSPQFVVTHLAREGTHELRAWTRLDARGETLAKTEATRPAAMPEAVFTKLAARLEANRGRALDLARPIVREKGRRG